LEQEDRFYRPAFYSLQATATGMAGQVAQ